MREPSCGSGPRINVAQAEGGAAGCGDEAEGEKQARRFSLALLVLSQLRSGDSR